MAKIGFEALLDCARRAIKRAHRDDAEIYLRSADRCARTSSQRLHVKNMWVLFHAKWP